MKFSTSMAPYQMKVLSHCKLNLVVIPWLKTLLRRYLNHVVVLGFLVSQSRIKLIQLLLDHLTSIKAMAEMSKMRDKDADGFYCHVCLLKLNRRTTMNAHVRGKIHKNNLSVLLSQFFLFILQETI